MIAGQVAPMVRIYSLKSQMPINGGELVPGPDPAQNSACAFCVSVNIADICKTASTSALRAAPVNGATDATISASICSDKHVVNTDAHVYVKYFCIFPPTVKRVHSNGFGNPEILFTVCPSTTMVLFQLADAVGIVVIAAAAPSP